ncbi:hypothetical protein [Pseudanabaena sp. FACHB-2040]|uniref:hypothetical protein n=1 Tax=Pseudanabaena sp. FACHB-2040 TaxID=2692859 RepID=UPI001684BE02|nr:hypothetical protein [Pseudanabaena sp. FACHB-2040]MBD2255985.1 hypothetical protein [Pseudanabaena sp. FACHB-2040]
MAYTNEPVNRVMETSTVLPVTEYHDLVRWGPIFAGLVVSIASQLVLTGLGAAVGLTTLANTGAPQSNAGEVGAAVGIWSIISLLISLFLGGWVTARACGPMNRKTALLNGAILWATTLAVSAWLLSSGVAGAFGIAAQGAGAVASQIPTGALPGGGAVPDPSAIPDPNVSTQQAQNIAGNAATVGWSFALGSLLGLVAAMIGAAVGVRHPRPYNNAPVR